MKDDLIAMAIAAAVILGAAWYVKRQAGAAIDSIAGAASDAWDASATAVKATVPYVNPADSGNIINRGVSAVGGAITSNDNWTLGGQIYDWTH